MQDLDKALADIGAIRSQIGGDRVRVSESGGDGGDRVRRALTSVLQFALLDDPTGHP